MSDIAIRVEGLGKQYKIGKAKPRYGSFRESVSAAFSSPFRRFRTNGNGQRSTDVPVNGHPSPVDVRPPSSVIRPSEDTIWALRDVSFSVKRGEVVGIIGRNGAGKSTLLKILSRITEPTTGEVDLHGRVGSLLEVGTGFHPELTGRENIYLNGSIIGMKRAEINKRFDEIVAFAEIEKFIDTPVKHYSSGMYVRLAFAVAAHLEPEILLVDEVLAVGDAQFQKKCLGKMGDVAKEGRTVLFVSHNMAAIQSLCSTAVCLSSGALIENGPASMTISNYLKSVIGEKPIPLIDRADRSGDGSVRISFIEVEGADSDKLIRSGSRLRVRLKYQSESTVHHPKFLVGIYDYSNTGIFLLDSEAIGGLPDVLPPEGAVTCITDCINLTPGRCFVNVALLKGGAIADYVQYATAFDVEAEDVYGKGKIPGREWVMCVLKHEWFQGAN